MLLKLGISHEYYEIQEKSISLLWKKLQSDLEPYPKYSAKRFKNLWQLYQFPWIFKLLLDVNTNKYLDEQLILLDYYIMNIPVSNEDIKLIHKKIEKYGLDFKNEYIRICKLILDFYKERDIYSYFRISEDGINPGYYEKETIYIPEPRISRLEEIKYINPSHKIVF